MRMLRCSAAIIIAQQYDRVIWLFHYNIQLAHPYDFAAFIQSPHTYKREYIPLDLSHYGTAYTRIAVSPIATETLRAMRHIA